MSAKILDGAMLSRIRRAALAERVSILRSKGIVPKLDVIVSANDPASVTYVQMKRRWAEKAGIEGDSFLVDEDTSQSQLVDEIQRLNQDPKVHGVLIQHPLPQHLDENEALIALGSAKDVDGITPESLGRLVAGMPGFRCATPLGIVRLLNHCGIEIQGKRAVVIGRSVILGKPAALLLLQENATVTITHSKTENLKEICREADILIAAVGKAEMVKEDWIKPGAAVIDAGYNKIEGIKGDVGDVDFEAASEVAGWISPVPGGVGPMTVTTLLENAVDAAEASTKS